MRLGHSWRSVERSGAGNHLLEVVEDEEKLELADVRGERVLRSERLSDRLGDQGRLAHWGKPHPEDTSLVVRNEAQGGFERQSSLAGTPGTRERKQACAVVDLREDFSELLFPADEGARRTRKVRVRNRLERRKGAISELEDRDGVIEVLQPMLTEIRQEKVRVEMLTGRARDEHLTAVSGSHDPRSLVDVEADVLRRGHERLAGVEAHADEELAPLGPGVREEGALSLARCGERLACALKGDDEGVAFVVHLVAAMAHERRAQEPAMVVQRLRVAVDAQLCDQPRGALDVGEEKGDRAAWLLRHVERTIAPFVLPDKVRSHR